MPALCRLRTIRIDLPGSGRSAGVEGDALDRSLRRGLRRVCAAGQVERVHVLAHSLGTIVALPSRRGRAPAGASLALFGPLLAPPDVARPAPACSRDAEARGEGVAGDAGDRGHAGAGGYLDRDPGDAARRGGLRARAVDAPGSGRLRAHVRGAGRCRRPPTPPRITCPTLLVTGDEDAVAPPQAVRLMGEKIARQPRRGLAADAGTGRRSRGRMTAWSSLRRFYAHGRAP